MSSTNTNSLAKLDDEDSVDQFININSIDSNSGQIFLLAFYRIYKLSINKNYIFFI